MDIQYLLALQDLRNATGDVFNEFFNALSKVAVEIMPFLPFIVFWCADKKWGYRFILSWGTAEVVNGVIKLTACAYRPWIRSDLIEPAGDSKVAATGYSFPSGHTVVATITYGTTAVWQWVKRRWLSVICIIMVLLTGFSRNFLGVHTPQDVFVGICESVAIIIIFGFAQKKLEGKERAKDILTIIGIIAVIAVLIYITQKPYPMDYVGDKLIVDPKVMMNDSFKASGLLLGILIGSLIERHRIHYEIPSDTKSLAMVTCIGAAIMFSWIRYFGPATVVQAFGSHWGNLISYAIMVLFALCIWPLVIRKVCKNK